MMPTPDMLGRHPKVPGELALTRQEVAAWLCREGLARGFWSIPEYEVDVGSTRPGRIDVVWARRNEAGNPIWSPVAAFEIEGHDVAFKGKPSLNDDLKKLAVAGRQGASFLAIVLFQIGPDGHRWKGNLKSDTLSHTAKVLRDFEPNETLHPRVLLDDHLPGILNELLAPAQPHGA